MAPYKKIEVQMNKYAVINKLNLVIFRTCRMRRAIKKSNMSKRSKNKEEIHKINKMNKKCLSLGLTMFRVSCSCEELLALKDGAAAILRKLEFLHKDSLSKQVRF